MNYDDVKKLRVVLPPQKEQDAIVAFLDDRCGKIESLIDEKSVLISELMAYKRSLIYETVTGKRKVV